MNDEAKTPGKRKKRRRRSRRQAVDWQPDRRPHPEREPQEPATPAAGLPPGFGEEDTEPEMPAVKQADLFETAGEGQGRQPAAAEEEAPRPGERQETAPAASESDWSTAKTVPMAAILEEEAAPRDFGRPVPPEPDRKPPPRDFGGPRLADEAAAAAKATGARRIALVPRGVARAVLKVLLATVNLVVTTVLVFGLVGAASYLVLKHYIGGKEVAAPNICGLSTDEALMKLSESDLLLQFEKREFSETVPRGYIVAQFPSPLVKVKTRTPIRVVISDGAARVRAPSVIGMTEINAGVALRAEARYDLDVGERAEIHSSEVAKGIVVAQQPPPGTPIPRGSRINVLVSKGPPPAYYEMPNLRGRTVQEARIALGTLRLNIAELREADQPGTRRGIVIDQQPRSGRRVSRDDKIILTTASGLDAPGGS